MPIRLVLFVNIALFAVAFHQWFATAVLLLFLIVSLVPLRVEIDNIGQLIFVLVGLAGAYVLTVVVGPAPKHPLSEAFALAQAFACVWMILNCEVRLFLSNAWGGQKINVLVTLVALFACGGNQLGYVYHGFVLCFAVLAMWTLAQDDPARPSWGQSIPKRKFLLSVATVGALVVALFLFRLLPYLEQILTRRLQFAMQHRMQSGFDTYFRLGSLSNMLQSKRIVLRIHGQYRSSIHLRGLVYTRYLRKHWRIPQNNRLRRYRVPQTLPSVPERMRIEYVSGDASHYFVPLFASHFAATHEQIRVDEMGLLLPLSDQIPEMISFVLKKLTVSPVLPPQKDDLQVPKSLRPAIHRLAMTWTVGQKTTEQKLHALMSRLRRDYQYSLSFQRPKDQDPILDFLFQNKQGHCEYFATALALLARSVGIPTRVVGGYLATEYNEIGSYYIVREQNAHAWVETWVSGRGWRTADATPPSGLLEHMPVRTSAFSGVLDSTQVMLGRFRNWLANLTIREMFFIIGGIVVFWVMLRLLRWWRQRDTLETVKQGMIYQEPLPAFEELLQILEATFPRKSSESLERYATRLQHDASSEWNQQASAFILTYTSLRYGRVGDEVAFSQQLRTWLKTSSRGTFTSNSG